MSDLHGQCIAVVSGKGGTGKTSFTAAVGSALARMGRRTLCFDCDVGLRNLDLALGLTDRALMDFSDVARGRCTLSDAVVEHPEVPNLFLLTAPAGIRGRPVTGAEMDVLAREIRRQFDFCLLDSPAGLGTGFALTVGAADRCVVITTPEAPSLRDAQHTVMELNQFPRGALHLVVTRINPRLLRRMHATIDDAIDTAGLPLLGVVPEDEQIPLSLSRGIPLLVYSSGPAAAAYQNIARRLCGQRVSLLRIR